MEAGGDKEQRPNIEQPLDLLALYPLALRRPTTREAAATPPRRSTDSCTGEGGALKPTSVEMADDHITAAEITPTLAHAKGRQRLLGSRPVGKSRSRNTMRPTNSIQNQPWSQSIALPPGSGWACASRAKTAYSPAKWSTAAISPIAQQIQPIGWWGRREAMIAPITE
jgi:hypothetical protein